MLGGEWGLWLLSCVCLAQAELAALRCAAERGEATFAYHAATTIACWGILHPQTWAVRRSTGVWEAEGTRRIGRSQEGLRAKKGSLLKTGKGADHQLVCFRV